MFESLELKAEDGRELFDAQPFAGVLGISS
jgi:hypothetical protein